MQQLSVAITHTKVAIVYTKVDILYSITVVMYCYLGATAIVHTKVNSYSSA